MIKMEPFKRKIAHEVCFGFDMKLLKMVVNRATARMAIKGQITVFDRVFYGELPCGPIVVSNGSGDNSQRYWTMTPNFEQKSCWNKTKLKVIKSKPHL